MRLMMPQPTRDEWEMIGLIAAALAWVVCLIVFVLLSGCGGGPETRQEQEAAATPQIEAGDLAEINQTLQQIQNTTSIVRQNFALDAERARIESQRLRVEEKRNAAVYLMLVGMILFALPFKLNPGARVKAIMLIVALCLIASPALILLWPF